MDRRRRDSASAPVTFIEERYKSSGSATPKFEDDEDAANRRTRGRNPLPPTRGPLFPPLPPKPPKNSPKNSPSTTPRSPATRAPSSGTGTSPSTATVAASSALAHVVANGESGETEIPDAADAFEADADADAGDGDDRPTLPGTSGTSLTPPPDDDEAMDVDGETAEDADADASANGAAPPADKADGDGEEDWESYRRHRGVRGFSDAAKAVKLEPDEAETPASASRDTPRTERGTSTGRARKRRGEDQLLLDDHLLPKEIRRLGSAGKKQQEDEDEQEEEAAAEEGKDDEGGEDEIEDDAEAGEGDEDDEESQEVTRCVCRLEDDDIMMIQCDKCNVWQHGGCMGIWGDEEAPDEYFCEECRPELHGPLKKYMRSKGRNVANFVPPTAEDLLHFYNPADKCPPSQSKRWADTSLLEARPKSRSHHRKDPPPETPDLGRDAGRRARHGPVTHSATAAAAAAAPGATKPVSKDRRRAHDRRVSIDVSPESPPASRDRPERHGREKSREKEKDGGGRGERAERDRDRAARDEEPKRRSTMNSRDAAYEEAVKAALEASRKEMEGKVEKKEDEAEDRKRRREDEDEPVKKGKKRREDDEGGEEPVPGKPKHPNQYTYRPKPAGSVLPAPSPMRRTAAGTPQPTLPPPAHEHGTRRAGAIASNLAAAPYNPASVNNLSWFLPEHLAAYADILPSAAPVALSVPAPRTLAFLSRNHFYNQRYGPFDDGRDADGKLRLPEYGPEREVEGEAERRKEVPARVKYPPKRMTTAEMRKRVRHVLEYVGRVQVEEGKRKERAGIVGIPAGLRETDDADKNASTVAERANGSVGIDKDGDVVMGDGAPSEATAASPAPAVPAPAAAASSPPPPPPTALQLLDELTRDLIAFQESFANGANGFASPALGGAAFETPAHVDMAVLADVPAIPDAEVEPGEAAPAYTVGAMSEVGEEEVDQAGVAEAAAGLEEAAGSEEVTEADVAVLPTAGAEEFGSSAAALAVVAQEPGKQTAAESTEPVEALETQYAAPEVITEAKTQVYRAGEVDLVVPEAQELAAAGGAAAVPTI
ncbi:Histone deacetylase complex subunit [Cryptotrichosporon argae]